MPRKIRPSRSSQAHLQNQSNIAQSHAPIPRALPEQSSASKPSGQPSVARQRKETIKSLQLRKKLREAENAAKAQEWGTKFEEYFAPISPLESDLEKESEKAWEDLQYFEGRDEKIANAPPRRKRTALDGQVRAKLPPEFNAGDFFPKERQIHRDIVISIKADAILRQSRHSLVVRHSDFVIS